MSRKCKKYVKRRICAGVIEAGAVCVLAVMLGGCGAVEKAENQAEPETILAAEPGETEQTEFVRTDTSILPVKKTEQIKVKAYADGSVKETKAEVRLELPEQAANGDNIEDVTNLTEIKNTKGDEEYCLLPDGQLLWENHGEPIEYRGTTQQELPVGLHITYTLDGSEISPEELAGKSGRVTIRFDYTNAQSGRDSFVPFTAMTVLMLPEEHFANVSVEHGHISRMGDDSIVLGMAFPGWEDALDLAQYQSLEDDDKKKDKKDKKDEEQFPEYVEVTADTTDFALDFTATIVSNGLFEELKQKDLEELGDMKADMQTLKDAVGKLADGTDQLKDGMNTYKDGLSTYTDGVASVNDGVKKLQDGLDQLNANKQSLDAGIAALSAKIETLAPTMSPEELAQMQQLMGLLQAYSDAVDQLAAGSDALAAGSQKLADSSSKLLDGIDKLIDGSAALKKGINKLDEKGIGKLYDMAADVSDLSQNVQKIRKRDVKYTSFTGAGEGVDSSVSFVIETEKIKK